MSTNTWTFVYDTTAGIPAVLGEVQPDESVIYYYREPNRSLIARQDGTDFHYYSFDELGSTRLIADSAGYVTDAYAYDAWGTVLSHDRYAGSIDQPYQYVGQLGYYTHYQEPDFSLLQLGVRFYDPEVGRFTQVDPAKDGINWYAYVEGTPLGAVDPTGTVRHRLVDFAMSVCGQSSCHQCVKKQTSLGSTELKQYLRDNPPEPPLDLRGKSGRNEMNAWGHCVRACRAVRGCAEQGKCGNKAGVRRYINDIYEGWPRIVGRILDDALEADCAMDVHNNDIGFECGDKAGVSCAECCYNRRKDWSYYGPEPSP